MNLSARKWLRSNLWYLQFRECMREGLFTTIARTTQQRRILATPSIRTATTGSVEVRVLTWRRDWINCLWAVKSFYLTSGCDFPLYIHDGGLVGTQAEKLLSHFPDAHFISKEVADRETTSQLSRRGFHRSLEYRQKNISTRKLFDFYLLSQADRIISIDSDIVFFSNPVELSTSLGGQRCNLYNQDCFEAYSISPKEIKEEFGIEVPPRVNSGLASIWKESIDFNAIERWLHFAPLFDNEWVTEQTLHAMCSSVFGLKFLPPTYIVSVEKGLPENAVCKHYPTAPRVWLYREGMPKAFKLFHATSA